MYCKNCKSENVDSAKFCAKCGAKLENKPKTLTKSCVSCGKPVSPSAVSCPHCGHPLKRQKSGNGCLVAALVGVGILLLIIILMSVAGFLIGFLG